MRKRNLEEKIGDILVFEPSRGSKRTKKKMKTVDRNANVERTVTSMSHNAIKLAII